MINEIATIPAPQQQAWLGLAAKKNEVSTDLAKMELKTQGILQKAKEADNYKAIDALLLQYRNSHKEMVAHRKNFTSIIEEKLIAPMMETEKRVNPKENEDYREQETRSLNIRIKEENKAKELNAKIAEKARFKTFVQNEYIRIETEFKTKIRRDIQRHYELCLNAGVQDPELQKLSEFIKTTERPQFNKFGASSLTREEMKVIFDECTPCDWERIFDSLNHDLEFRFANYEQDLHNATEAIEHAKQEAELREMEEKQKAQEETAMNTLITKAESVEVEVEAPKIKRTLKVVTEESEAWAKAVMVNFITTLPYLTKYIRVKSWAKLSVAQMATYLGQYATDEGVTFNNLKLEECLK